ncbi:kinase-like domain-containing protein [Rhizophagus diaphanus]|nr:kinase-like domain-containing protein [Rhizophagus diaphanus] [Rhizophagus sp. MUCL 43196]
MTSFNEWVDRDYIEYNEFSNVKTVGKGAFGIVESADWKNYEIKAALKTLTIDDYDLNNFVKELESLKKVSFHPNVIGFYGITKEPLSNKYIMVLEYANQGNLREYLKSNFKFLQWSDKIQMALDIARGLKCLHLKNIIHRDLHAKNILVSNNRLMIADFGTSKQLSESTSNSTYSTANGLGMPEYNEPQLFKIINYKKDKKSDIFSLGVLLWEISSGRPPFPGYLRIVLGSHISYHNLREKPIDGTPQEYQQLYQECWNNEPKSRPDIEIVYETLSQLSQISLRESSHKTNGFTEEALKNFIYIKTKFNILLYSIEILDNRNQKFEDALISEKILIEESSMYIPFKEFHNVEYLNEGGFGILYKADWSTRNGNTIKVILRLSKNSYKNFDEFFDEWKYHIKCLNLCGIINLHGITKDPNTFNYMVIMNYVNNGNLRSNLTKIIKYNWKQKLYLLYQIISGLSEIHEQQMIHCNFHDGKILIHKYNEREEDKVYISGLRLCKYVSSSLKGGNVYSIMPFVAPEVLIGGQYTQASDIYSFSMIMWEFTSGVFPFNNRAYDLQLSVNICRGERPEIIENTPQCYIDLMKKCWNEDPLKRPSSKEVLNIIEEWIFYFPEKINDKLLSNIMEFINAPVRPNSFIN